MICDQHRWNRSTIDFLKRSHYSMPGIALVFRLDLVIRHHLRDGNRTMEVVGMGGSEAWNGQRACAQAVAYSECV